MLHGTGEYNREQVRSFHAIRTALADMDSTRLGALRELIEPYLAFRRDLDDFHARHIVGLCDKACFKTGVSACCGFESIFTYFADQVIAWLVSSERERNDLLRVLARPNSTMHCVYLGTRGCIWKTSPISCAMFLCEQAKRVVAANGAENWARLQRREKDFTRPDKPILFDDIERIFMEAGVTSPHMYCHRLPGLLKLKARWTETG